MPRFLLFLLALGGFAASWAKAEPPAELGIRAPRGFEVTLYAGDDLAHDIFSMTIDARGRVVVAGRDYVKILHDDNGDGKADRATLFSAVPKSGAHGMVFDGPDLICTGDDALLRLRDSDGDGVADGEPEVWARLRSPEHGANGLARGPDGWFYVVCGNDAGVGPEHANGLASPVTNPNCGAVLRFSPDGKQSEIFAHGFRNPYDLDFDAHGTLFTVDADGERDHHLPWYAPTRLFDVAQGMHHGWVQKGWQRSWNRPAYFFDNVPRLHEIGRGSPTGLVVYRHRQFPGAYRGNVFSACWTLGRVYHLPLEPRGSSYECSQQVFLETTGEVGFAPVDLAVGPAGDLFVAIGGRRTRGSVFRVRYTGPPEPDEAPRPGIKAYAPELAEVLLADQPQAAWSRAAWLPKAKELGKERLEAACIDPALDGACRARGIEILTEVFDGLSIEKAEKLARWAVPDQRVQMRLAWSLGRKPQGERGAALLAWFTREGHDLGVRRAAWEALAALPPFETPLLKEARWNDMHAQEDRSVRAAAFLADLRHGAEPFEELEERTPQETLAWLWRLHFRGELKPAHLTTLRGLLPRLAEIHRGEEAVRLMQLALGDLRVEAIEPDVYAGYSVRAEADALVFARKTIPFELPLEERVDSEFNREWLRLAGAVNAESEALVELIAEILGEIDRRTSDPEWPGGVTDRLHYLIALSRIGGTRSARATEQTANALVSLHHRMNEQRIYPSRNWPLRVGEAFTELCRRDPLLAEAVTGHARFSLPEHSLFAARMAGSTREKAARKLLAAASAAGEDARWSAELVGVVSSLPAEESLPALRRQWSDFGLRDSILPVLARHAAAEDRERFVDALSSVQPAVVEEAATALRKRGGRATPEELLAAFRALKQLCASPQFVSARRDVAALLKTWAGQEIVVNDSATVKDPHALYLPWFEWFSKAHPTVAAEMSGFSGDNAAVWRERLAKLDLAAGDAARGKTVFEKRSCHRCHGEGSGQLGPDLGGAAGRFSRDDLFAAIVDPSRDVAPLYQTTQIVTASGKVYHGLVVYESPDGTLLQTAPDITLRIAGEEILSMRKSRQSLMPEGLLQGTTDADLADLYAYLKTLRAAR